MVEEIVVLSPAILENFKVKVNPVGGATRVWTTQGSQAASQMSIWSPVNDVSVLHHNKVLNTQYLHHLQ
jgi:hypothetical protein